MAQSQQNDALSQATPGFAGARIAAILIGLVLVLAGIARFGAFSWFAGFARPHYAAALVLQTGILLLLLIESFPWSNRPRPYQGMPAAWIFALYVVVCFISCRWAPQASFSFIGAITAAQGVIWALLVSRLVRDAASFRLVLRAVVAAGVLASLVGIFYVASYHPAGQLPPWIQIFTEGITKRLKEELVAAMGCIEQVQGHRNFLAIFLLPPILLCLAEVFSKFLSRGAAACGFLRMPRWLAILAILVMVIALAICQSWGSLIGIVAGAVCLLAMRLSNALRIVLLVLALAAGIAAIVTLAQPSVQERFVNKAQGTRLFMWKGTLKMIHERPVLGWGTGMFMLYFPDYKPTAPMQYGWLASQTIYPHDELLLVAVEVGVLGLALYLAGTLWAAGHFIRRERRTKDVLLRLAGWGVLAGMLAMFLHGLVEISLRFWAPAAMFWTMMGLLMAMPNIIEPPAPRSRPYDRALGGVVFAFVCLMVIFAGRWLIVTGARSEWLMGQGSARIASANDYADAQLQAARLSRYVPDVMEALSSRASALDRLTFSREPAPVDLKEERLKKAISAYTTIYDISPGYITHGGPVRVVLGLAYLRLARLIGPSDEGKGREALERAHRLGQAAITQDPYEPVRRMLMADILLTASRHNLPEAIQQLKHGAAGPNAGPIIHFRLASLLAEDGRTGEALQELDEAAKLIKQDDPLMQSISALRERIRSQTSGK